MKKLKKNRLSKYFLSFWISINNVDFNPYNAEIFCTNHRNQSFCQFEIIISYLVIVQQHTQKKDVQHYKTLSSAFNYSLIIQSKIILKRFSQNFVFILI